MGSGYENRDIDRIAAARARKLGINSNYRCGSLVNNSDCDLLAVVKQLVSMTVFVIIILLCI